MISHLLSLFAMLPAWAWKVLPCFLGLSFAVAAGRKRWPEASFALLLIATLAASRLTRTQINPDYQWAFKALIDLGTGAGFCVIAHTTHDRRALIIGLLCGCQVVFHCAYAIHLIEHGYILRADLIHYWLSFVIAWAEALAFSRGVYGGRKRGRDHWGHSWGDRLSRLGRRTDPIPVAGLGEVGAAGRGLSDA